MVGATDTEGLSEGDEREMGNRDASGKRERTGHRTRSSIILLAPTENLTSPGRFASPLCGQGGGSPGSLTATDRSGQFGSIRSHMAVRNRTSASVFGQVYSKSRCSQISR